MTFDDRYACTEPLLNAEIGTLWRAEDRSLRRPVAVALLDDASAAERFLATAQMLARQPNAVVRALEQGTREDGVAFFVIEPPPGAALAERLSRPPPLLVEDVVRVALEVLSELEGVHGAGAAHGHIDPWTVWVAMHGKQLVGRLVGLGLYRAGVDGRTARDVAYAAPELLRDGTFGPQCDVWSLGVLLYECLTGGHPFARASVDATRAAVLAGQAPSLAKLAPELPPALAAAVEKSMASEPSARFEDAKTMRRAIFVAMLTAGKRARASVPTFEAGAAAHGEVAPAVTAAPAPVSAAAAAPAPAAPAGLDAPAAAPLRPRGHFPKSTIVGFAPAVEPVLLPGAAEPPRPDRAHVGSWLGLEKAEAQPPMRSPAPALLALEAETNELLPPVEVAMSAHLPPVEVAPPAPLPPVEVAVPAPPPPAESVVAAPPSPPPDVAERGPSLRADTATEDLLLSLPPEAAAEDDLLLSLPPEAAADDDLLLSLPPETAAPSRAATDALAEAHVFGRPKERATDRALPPPARLPRVGARDWQSAPPPSESTSPVAAPVVLAQAEPSPPEPLDVAKPVVVTPAPRPAARVAIDVDEPQPAKSRGWVWATLALAAVVAAGGGYWWYATQSGGASPPVAPPHVSTPEPAPEPAEPELAASPPEPSQAEPAAIAAPGEPAAPAAVVAPGEPAVPEPVAVVPPTEPAAPTVAVAEPVEPPPAAPRTKVQRRVRGGPRHGGAARTQPGQAPGLVGDPGF